MYPTEPAASESYLAGPGDTYNVGDVDGSDLRRLMGVLSRFRSIQSRKCIRRKEGLWFQRTNRRSSTITPKVPVLSLAALPRLHPRIR